MVSLRVVFNIFQESAVIPDTCLASLQLGLLDMQYGRQE